MSLFSTKNRFDLNNPENQLALNLLQKIDEDTFGYGGSIGGTGIPSGFAGIGDYADDGSGAANMCEAASHKYVQDFDSFANSLLGDKGQKKAEYNPNDIEKASVLHGQNQNVYGKPHNDTTDQLHHSLDDHYFPIKGKNHSIYRYSEHSKGLNSALINRYDAGGNMKKLGAFHEYAPHVNENDYVDHAELDELTRETKTPHDLTLYSGIRRHPMNRADKNGMVHFPAYTSASLNAEPAVQFATKSPHHLMAEPNEKRNKHILKIHYPMGSKGVYIGKQTDIPGEREFLIPRGVTMKISPNPRIIHEPVTNRHIHIWDVHPVEGHK